MCSEGSHPLSPAFNHFNWFSLPSFTVIPSCWHICIFLWFLSFLFTAFLIPSFLLCLSDCYGSGSLLVCVLDVYTLLLGVPCLDDTVPPNLAVLPAGRPCTQRWLFALYLCSICKRFWVFSNHPTCVSPALCPHPSDLCPSVNSGAVSLFILSAWEGIDTYDPASITEYLVVYKLEKFSQRTGVT